MPLFVGASESYDTDAWEAYNLKKENAKLREQIHWLKQGDILHVLTDQEYIDQCERERLMQVSIDALDKDNAKLRELVRDMYHCSDPCNDCPHYNGSNSGFYCGLGIGWKARRMHELGIEVDE